MKINIGSNTKIMKITIARLNMILPLKRRYKPKTPKANINIVQIINTLAIMTGGFLLGYSSDDLK